MDNEIVAAIKRLSTVERVFCLLPLLLVALGGAVGGLWGVVAVGFNLWLFGHATSRTARIALASLVLVVALGCYLVTAYALKAGMPQDLKELIGIVVLVLGGLWFLAEFSRGIWQAKVLDPFSLFSTRLARKDNPRRYFAAMVFWAIPAASVMWLAYAALLL